MQLLKTKGGKESELRDNDAKRYHDVSSPAGSGLPPPLERSSCCFDPGDCTRRDQWVHFNVNQKDKVCVLPMNDKENIQTNQSSLS